MLHSTNVKELFRKSRVHRVPFSDLKKKKKKVEGTSAETEERVKSHFMQILYEELTTLMSLWRILLLFFFLLLRLFLLAFLQLEEVDEFVCILSCGEVDKIPWNSVA